MVKWEYQLVPMPITSEKALAQLNALGAEGWEVCVVEYRCWVVKRQKQG